MCSSPWKPLPGNSSLNQHGIERDVALSPVLTSLCRQECRLVRSSCSYSAHYSELEIHLEVAFVAYGKPAGCAAEGLPCPWRA